MQLAKGSAEDLPSGLATNFRAFGFDERICNESIQRMGLKKTCACLAASVASRTCIKTSTRLIAKGLKWWICIKVKLRQNRGFTYPLLCLEYMLYRP